MAQSSSVFSASPGLFQTVWPHVPVSSSQTFGPDPFQFTERPCWSAFPDCTVLSVLILCGAIVSCNASLSLSLSLLHSNQSCSEQLVLHLCPVPFSPAECLLTLGRQFQAPSSGELCLCLLSRRNYQKSKGEEKGEAEVVFPMKPREVQPCGSGSPWVFPDLRLMTPRPGLTSAG